MVLSKSNLDMFNKSIKWRCVMLYLLRYLKNYKKETVLAPLFKMMEAFFDLIVPLVVAKIIDDGIKKDNIDLVLKLGAVMILLTIVGGTIAITANYFAARAAAGFGYELRLSLFKKIQSLSYSQLDELGTSTLITRITTDLNQVQAQVNMFIRLIMRSPFIIFGAMIMAFLVDSKTAVIFVVAIPLLAIIVFGIMLISIPLYVKVQEKLDRVTNSTRENVNGVRVIRAFNRQDSEAKNFDEENIVLQKIQILAGRVSQIINPATFIVVNVAILAILLVGGDRVNLGYMSQGKIVAMVNYMSQILIELIKLATLIINVTKAVACAKRIEEVLVTKSDDNHGDLEVADKNSEYILELDKVGFSYNNFKEKAISDVSIKIKPGETIGIIGGTGSGKSTLINLIAGFYDATEGEIKVCGKDIKEYSKKFLAEFSALVPQKNILFKGTIRENMLWGRADATKEEIDKAIEISQSKEFIEKDKDGLERYVAPMGTNFSGGQRQRLTIARALLKKSEIIILDDSTSALDFATESKFRKAIKEIESTKIIISQRTSSILDADQIIVLDDGAVVGIGNHDSLLNECEIYREIYETQFSD